MSTNTKLERLNGLIDTKDVTDWENQFLNWKELKKKIKKSVGGFFLFLSHESSIEARLPTFI